jgi:serine/threonine protein kinase
MPYFTFNDLPPKLKVAQLWGIMEDIASGVAFIHQKGEVHRDIKPANGTYPDFSV